MGKSIKATLSKSAIQIAKKLTEFRSLLRGSELPPSMPIVIGMDEGTKPAEDEQNHSSLISDLPLQETGDFSIRGLHFSVYLLQDKIFQKIFTNLKKIKNSTTIL
ncbi:MAG: hypothetical protein U5L09_19910 [Bacteroidales bacterium]|nr:hypothetical protein [Bacteroidales bacterium]